MQLIVWMPRRVFKGFELKAGSATPCMHASLRLVFRAGIAPYMALELTAFDMMPRDMPAFARGFSAALIATSFCYPLDTLRCARCSGNLMHHFVML